jgi:hypothetical protein
MPLDGLRDLINNEEIFLLKHYPDIRTILMTSFTVVTSIESPVTSCEYHDPTCEQYAVIQDKQRSLDALFSLTQSDSTVPFDHIFNPRTSNTKETLLTLAIIENRLTIVRYLIKYITDHFQSRTIEFLTLAGKRADTPLSVAVQYGRWEAVQLLCEAGVDPLGNADFPQSPFLSVLFKARDKLAVFEASRLSERLPEVRWDPQTLQPSRDGIALVPFLEKVFGPGAFLNGVLEAVRAVAPGALSEALPADGSEEDAQETFSCEAPNCDEPDPVLKLCSKCKRYFCGGHIDEHDCIEAS